MIDLRQNLKQVEQFIYNGIEKFRGDVAEPNWVGVYSCPRSGWVIMCFDTRSDLDESRINLPVFEYVDYALIGFDVWFEEIERLGDLLYKDIDAGLLDAEYDLLVDHTGETITVKGEFGDDEFEAPFFSMLRTVALKAKCGIGKYNYVVQLLDSKYFEKL